MTSTTSAPVFRGGQLHRLPAGVTHRTVLDAPIPPALAALIENRDTAITAAVELPAGEVPWTSPAIMFTDEDTSDLRMFPLDAGTLRTLPLSLTFCHNDEIIVGRIDELTLQSGSCPASGVFADNDTGRYFAALVAGGFLRGVSVDLVCPRIDYEPIDYDDDGYPMNFRMVALEWELGGASLTPVPAFADAFVVLGGGVTPDEEPAPAEEPEEPAPADDEEPTPDQTSAVLGDDCVDCGQSARAARVASADVPLFPPAEWFDDPQLGELTAPVWQDDGRCFGHLAGWGICHMSFADECVLAPRSALNYALFRTGYLETADGGQVATGVLTMDTGHADRFASVGAAVSHYDNTGTAFADVVTGEDEHGIWFAGALRSDLDAEHLRAVRASAPSGDWRWHGEGYELVACLLVNVPGFPVARNLVASGENPFAEFMPRAGIVGDRPVSLVASASAVDIARLVQVRDRNVTGGEVDELRARVARAESTIAAQARALSNLEPAIREAARGRIRRRS